MDVWMDGRRDVKAVVRIAFIYKNMSNDKGKPSSLYFKWSKLNIFNTNPMFPYEWERERERDDNKATWFYNY